MEGNVCHFPESAGSGCRRELRPPLVDDEASTMEASMITQLKRHEVQTLLKAGPTQKETAGFAKVSLRTVRRIAEEPEVLEVDDGKERGRRSIGRPSTTQVFKTLVEQLLREDPTMLSVEILRRARLDGYAGGKSAMFALAASMRPAQVRL